MLLTICTPCLYGYHENHREVIQAPPPGMLGGSSCRCKGECVDGRYVPAQFKHIKMTIQTFHESTHKIGTMIETQKYVRKPLYVDAVRVTEENFEEIAKWCQGEIAEEEVPGQEASKQVIKVRVHNPKNPRQTRAVVGDWLLYTERGYKIYTNRAFRESFDQVDEIQAAAPVISSLTNGVTSSNVPQPNETIAVNNVADSKTILTAKEQREMDPEELRELLKSGEVVLEQDLAGK